MSVYMKRFIYASLLYLAAATIIGFLNAVPEIRMVVGFAHVHLNLLGFMAMMVFGIGYFILPRFNGSDLAHPSWVPVHFWLANIGLVGMVVFRGLEYGTGEGGMYHGLFMTFALMQAVAVFMFVFNMWKTLMMKVPTAHPVAAPTPQPVNPNRITLPQAGATKTVAAVTVSAESRVADLVDMHPPVKELLVSAGLSSLALPGHIDMVRKIGVTLGMACRNHGLDLDTLVDDIRNELRSAGMMVAQKNVAISGETLIGDILKQYPEARPVFQRHFGSGCFDCPGQAFESVTMACKMHNINEQQFLRELAGAMG